MSEGEPIVIHGETARVEVRANPGSIELSMDRDVSVRDRLNHVRTTLAGICATPAEQPDADTSRQHLHGSYVDLWALNEACQREGVAGPTVKAAINADAQIARSMDLGNAAKHGTPLKTMWSGQQPTFGKFTQKMPPEGGWTTDEVVAFDGQPYSGVAIAKDALAAWEQLAAGWGLL